MKPAIGISIIAAIFLVAAVGGFMARHDASGQAHCPFAALGNGDCGDVMDSFASVMTHIGMAAGFSAGIAGSFAALFAILAACALFGAAPPILQGAFSAPFAPKEGALHAAERKRRRWHTVHEKRDPSYSSAAGA